MRIKQLLLLAAFLIGAVVSVSAQSENMTSKIKNPSFEVNNTEGWTVDGMSCQTNNVFTMKGGNVYLEKWTGRGGAVGNASAKQVITDLPAGDYTLTVAAQNIQEDAPTAKQTGVKIFANNAITEVNVANDYSVTVTVIDGKLEIGIILDGATGNYVCVDNFRLSRTEDMEHILSSMDSVVKEAYSVDINNDSPERTELIEARNAAQALMNKNTSEGVTEAVVRLQNAIYNYRLSIASSDKSIDMTDKIVNPSFEVGGTSGWVNNGMWTQSGGVFPYHGNVFVEAWIYAGGKINDVSISQSISVPNGQYVLSAISQNIEQANNDAAAKNGYIFAENMQTEVGRSGTYSVKFTVIEGQALIGFKTVNTTGNWMCVDNFHLEYIGRSVGVLLDALKKRYTEAEGLLGKHMNSTVKETLQQSINAAKAQSDLDGMEAVATTLRQSMEAAQSSADAYSKLQTVINNAKSKHISGTDDAEFLAAIDVAQSIYSEALSNDQTVEEAIAKLDKEILKYMVTNSKGKAPQVTTVSYVARGATGALGRSIVSGNYKEKGFCWATHPEPTVLDECTTFSYDINGPMYLMQPLKPATVYYVRAYAITSDYAVGYGEVRKVITLPMGNSGYWYNWGGSPDENERIDKALADCIYYYNNWSATTNFTISCSYGSGTPTADCSYGGSMRVGPNASYQRTGTILHESNHGVGVGTSGRWWDTNLHEGEWKGWRANSLLQFIENNTTSKMAGDNMHMWPYGINGAHEDSGWPMLYIANVMITQALHEDGLIPPGHGGCKPAYVFEQDDDTKYYLTNENSSYGSGKAYLTESSTGVLSWSEPTGSVLDDDAYAWYITFNPSAQLYSIRNAKSGKYFTYGTNIKTAKVTTPGANERFHLMVGRQEKTIGGNITARPFWIMAGADVEAPISLTAQASGKVASPNFDISDGASAQRWFILSAKDVDNAANGAINLNRDKLITYAKAAKAMLNVPHQDTVEGVSEDLTTMADNYLATAQNLKDTESINAAISELWAGMKNFLKTTVLDDENHPYDLTFLVEDTKMQSADVWGVAPTVNFNCSEFFEKTFTMQQTIKDMPLGTYEVRLQGFQRPGAWTSMYNRYIANSLKTTARIYVGTKYKAIKSIMDDARPSSMGRGTEQYVGNIYYIPDNMEAAEAYFDDDLYMNSFVTETTKDGNIVLKFSCTSSSTSYWTIFRNISLHYRGNPAVTGIDSAVEEVPQGRNDIYDLNGRKVTTPQRGVYIINGKKYIK